MNTHKVGSTLYLYFWVFDGGAGKTGLVDANFTKRIVKDGTTSQASTGVTIAEVSAANEPGRYVATCSGSTSFAATTGVYDVVLHWSSQTADQGAFATVTVTTDGTGAGSWGDASFTATASDGRVTDGVSPVEGATIRILDPDGDLWVLTTTDASGVYGPVYFEQDGTFTVSVQKAGYTTATYSIVVIGAVATGPGADATITASSAGSGLTFAALKAYALRQWFDKSDSQAETVVGEVVNEAAELASQEKDWTWFSRMLTVDLVAPYSTGTIAISAGGTTVTGSGTTFPTWAAGAVLIYNGQVYDVLSRTNGTTLVLKQAWPLDAISGASYVLARYSYTLPDNILVLDAAMLGNTWPGGAQFTSFRQLLLRRDGDQSGGGPYDFAFHGDQFMIWPYADAARRVNLSCRVRPAKLVSDSDELDWNPDHEILLHRAIDYTLSTRGKCLAGTTDQCRENYQHALARAMARDKSPGSVDINRRTGSSTSWLRLDMSRREVNP